MSPELYAAQEEERKLPLEISTTDDATAASNSRSTASFGAQASPSPRPTYQKTSYFLDRLLRKNIAEDEFDLENEDKTDDEESETDRQSARNLSTNVTPPKVARNSLDACDTSNYPDVNSQTSCVNCSNSEYCHFRASASASMQKRAETHQQGIRHSTFSDSVDSVEPGGRDRSGPPGFSNKMDTTDSCGASSNAAESGVKSGADSFLSSWSYFNPKFRSTINSTFRQCRQPLSKQINNNNNNSPDVHNRHGENVAKNSSSQTDRLSDGSSESEEELFSNVGTQTNPMPPRARTPCMDGQMRHNPGVSPEPGKHPREKLLIYTWGSETYIPHKIGVKRMKYSDFFRVSIG